MTSMILKRKEKFALEKTIWWNWEIHYRRREKRGTIHRKSWRDVGSQCWYKIFFRKHSYLYINLNIFNKYTCIKLQTLLLDITLSHSLTIMNFAYYKKSNYFKRKDISTVFKPKKASSIRKNIYINIRCRKNI